MLAAPVSKPAFSSTNSAADPFARVFAQLSAVAPPPSTRSRIRRDRRMDQVMNQAPGGIGGLHEDQVTPVAIAAGADREDRRRALEAAPPVASADGFDFLVERSFAILFSAECLGTGTHTCGPQPNFSERYRRIEILLSVRIRHILLEESRCEDHTQAKSNRPEEEPCIVPRLATVAHATMGAQDQRESRMGLILFGQKVEVISSTYKCLALHVGYM